MIETHDLFLRALAVPVEKKNKKKKAKDVEDVESYPADEPKWPDILAFDTESGITADQSLTIGVWRRCQLIGDAYEVAEEGIFHADDLPAKDRKILEAYVETGVSDVPTFPP